MDSDKLNELNIEALWALLLKVDSELNHRIAVKKATLDDYLHKLGLGPHAASFPSQRSPAAGAATLAD